MSRTSKIFEVNFEIGVDTPRFYSNLKKAYDAGLVNLETVNSVNKDDFPSYGMLAYRLTHCPVFNFTYQYYNGKRQSVIAVLCIQRRIVL